MPGADGLKPSHSASPKQLEITHAAGPRVSTTAAIPRAAYPYPLPMLLDLACARASLPIPLNAIRMVSRETRVLRALSGVNFKARGPKLLHVQHWDFRASSVQRPDRRVDVSEEQRAMPPTWRSVDLRCLAFRCKRCTFRHPLGNRNRRRTSRSNSPPPGGAHPTIVSSVVPHAPRMTRIDAVEPYAAGVFSSPPYASATLGSKASCTRAFGDMSLFHVKRRPSSFVLLSSSIRAGYISFGSQMHVHQDIPAVAR